MKLLLAGWDLGGMFLLGVIIGAWMVRRRWLHYRDQVAERLEARFGIFVVDRFSYRSRTDYWQHEADRITGVKD